MINLLPADDKKQIRAARSNVLLLRYNFLMIVVVAFLGVATGFAYYYLSDSLNRANSIVAQNAQKESGYSKVKSDADAFRSKLSEAKSVFDSQIDYSAALVNIAHLIPDGATIDDLTLNKDSFSTPMTITVNVEGEHQAATVRDNFKNSPLFSNVTVGTVNTSGDKKYPYSIVLTVSMSKEVAK